MKRRIAIAISALAITLLASVAGFAASPGEVAYDKPTSQSAVANVPTVPAAPAKATTRDVSAPASQTAASTGVLPVTGFDALLIFGAAAAAGGAAFALRRASRR